MSERQDQTSQASVSGVDLPSFPVAFRGYDRDQVDVYIRVTAQQLASERQRAENLQRQQSQLKQELERAATNARPSFDALGAEAGRVLEQAGQSAKILIAEAEARARKIVEEAEQSIASTVERSKKTEADAAVAAKKLQVEALAERERLLDDAGKAAKRVVIESEEKIKTRQRSAESDLESVRKQHHEERKAAEAELTALTDQRERIRSHLSQIHHELNSLLNRATDAPAQAQPQVAASTVEPAPESESSPAPS
jgi:cell division septum initiation protein DivIVA